MELVNFTTPPRILLHTGDTSMSKSFKGLMRVVQLETKREAKTGDVYVFFNKKRTHCKVLIMAEKGEVIVYKRLSTEVFDFEHGRGFKTLKAVNPQKLLAQLKEKIINEDE